MIPRIAWSAFLGRTLAAVCVFLLVNAAEAAPFKAISADDQTATMRRGMNVMDADPVWGGSPAWFEVKHFRLLRDAGFDTVRINLHVFSHMDASGRIGVSWLKTLDKYIRAALDDGFTVVLDVHDNISCDKDIENCATKLQLAWDQIASRYKDESNKLLFELLNEPFGKLTPEIWNVLSRSLLKVVRRSNPNRNVVIGPAGYGKLEYLSTLQLPSDDRHIVVAVHYYWPPRFTHQGVEWIPEFAHITGLTFGSDEQQAKIAEDFGQIKAWSKTNNRPIFLGEFGAYERSDMASRATYISSITRKAEALGFPWAFWEFENNFAAYDMKRAEWVGPILQALVPKN